MAIRNTGTIMVRRERGVLVQAMRPKVHTRAIRTVPEGISIPRRFRKKKKRIKPMRENVARGNVRKSFSVNCTRAAETIGILTW